MKEVYSLLVHLICLALGVYHLYTQECKDTITDTFSDPNSILQVAVGIIAFGMRLDCCNVWQIIDWGASNNIEAYLQETGQAGRDGLPAKGALYVTLHPANRFIGERVCISSIATIIIIRVTNTSSSKFFLLCSTSTVYVECEPQNDKTEPLQTSTQSDTAIATSYPTQSG